MKEKIIIDNILGIEITESKYVNEFQSLMHLLHGLSALYNSVKGPELDVLKNNHGHKISFDFDGMGQISKETSLLLPCIFHWFGISICNYARLVGYIVAREKGLLSDKDLYNSPNHKKIKNVCDDYISGIEEIKHILRWRNKVAAHFALTDPRKEDNIATMEASIIYPVSFANDRFRTGVWIIGKGNEQEMHESEIPQWSLTESYEILSKRFWPKIIFNF